MSNALTTRKSRLPRNVRISVSVEQQRDELTPNLQRTLNPFQRLPRALKKAFTRDLTYLTSPPATHTLKHRRKQTPHHSYTLARRAIAHDHLHTRTSSLEHHTNGIRNTRPAPLRLASPPKRRNAHAPRTRSPGRICAPAGQLEQRASRLALFPKKGKKSNNMLTVHR